MDSTTSKAVVAIVDADPRMLESLVDLLESGGYAARGYLSAGALLADGLAGIDALVTDIGAPGSASAALRDAARTTHPDLPVFLITTRHELTEEDHVRDADGFFRKPFNATALLEAIAKALNSGKSGD